MSPRRVRSTDSKQESTAKEIDLQDDDPRALRALLTYIYTFEYAESPEQKDDWRFHLAVYRVARKYMVKKLKDKAFAAFHYLRLTLNDMSQVLEVLEALYEEADDTLTQSADTLLQIHLKTLGDFEGFRAAIEEDKVLMWRYLDKLKAGLKPEPKPKQETEPGKVEMHWARCSCGWRRFLSPGQKVWPACGRRACSVTSAPAAQTVQSMWLRRKPDGTVDVPFV
ncbi:unnamed protein product [Lecanosticta acicola]|uniref:Unnamed protein product n=1 Tax=Lecanosticta acicola TaxID=111012 RepID=A0AAI8Z7P3_9PEZI|nr:unnamed protein product [Lecanosticta acicola]